MIAMGATGAANADPVQQVTNALAAAIAQRVGDQVSANQSADLRNSVSGNFGASGVSGTSTFFGMGSLDSWVSPDHLFGGAFDYATDDKNSFNVYGGSGYFADVYKRTDRSAAFVLLILNIAQFDTPLISQTSFAGTVDANWQWRGDMHVTRFDIGYTGSGTTGGGSYASNIFANVEEDFLHGTWTPYLDGGISEVIVSGFNQTSGHAGAGFRAEVSDRTTFNLDGGANISNQTGWYANASLRARF